MNLWYVGHLVLIQGAMVNILLALSIQVSLRTGVFSVAGVGFYGIGSYTTVILTIRYNLPALVTIAAGMLLAAAVAYLLAWIVARLDGIYLGMATIAFVLVLGVVVVNGGSLTGGANGLYGALSDLPNIGIYAVVAITVVLLAFSERGRLGRRIDAVREDPQLATAMGINVARARRLSFVVSGLLGACAGSLEGLTQTTVSQQNFSFDLVVLGLTIIIVGGSGSWLGAAIGAVIFTWLPSVLSFFGAWQTVVYGGLVALAAIWVPGGIVGFVTGQYRVFDRRRRRRAPVAEPDDLAAVTPSERILDLIGGGPKQEAGQ